MGGGRARSNLATIPFSSARCRKLLSLASLPFLLIRFPRQPLARPPCALFLPLPPTLFSRGSSREPRERVTPPPACALRGTLEVRKALLDERPRVRRRASKNDARSTLLPQETPNWHARSPLPCHYPLRSLFVTRLDSVSMRRRCSCQKEHWRPPGAGRAFRDSNFFQSRERERGAMENSKRGAPRARSGDVVGGSLGEEIGESAFSRPCLALFEAPSPQVLRRAAVP